MSEPILHPTSTAPMKRYDENNEHNTTQPLSDPNLPLPMISDTRKSFDDRVVEGMNIQSVTMKNANLTALEIGTKNKTIKRINPFRRRVNSISNGNLLNNLNRSSILAVFSTTVFYFHFTLKIALKVLMWKYPFE